MSCINVLFILKIKIYIEQTGKILKRGIRERERERERKKTFSKHENIQNSIIEYMQYYFR